jgi:hypothetical protein
VGEEVLEKVEIIPVLLKYSQLVSALLDGNGRKINYFGNRSCSDAKWDRKRNACSYVLFRTMMEEEQMVWWLR